MKFIEFFTQPINKIILFACYLRDSFKHNPDSFLDEYSKCKHMILNCIDDDVRNPVPRQLLSVIPKNNYHAFVNMFLALQLLLTISANFEAEGYEVNENWNEKLMSCHRHLTERLYHGLSRSDQFKFREDESELIKAVNTAFDTKFYYEDLFSYSYKSKAT